MSYIGNEPVVSATRTVTEAVAIAGQTVFYPNGGYTVGYLDVFINGVKIGSGDFTASDGTSITLGTACAASDEVRMDAYGTFDIGNTAVQNRTTYAMWENSQTIGQNYSINAGNSAISAGPITISDGVSVTIPSGSRWVIL